MRKRVLGILVVLLAVPGHTFGQVGQPSENWTGTWILNTARSTFGSILFPGVPRNLQIVGQKLRITAAESKLRLSGETVVKIAGKTSTSKDDTSLSLDGTESVIGPAVLALRPIDAYAFEIVSTVKQADREYRQISRFSFSGDSTTLTETKIQTARATASDNAPKVADQVLRSSTSTLVFSRKP